MAKPLWKSFIKMAKGNAEALHVVKLLAATARAIDPDCPHGPHGVLDSIASYGLKPTELVQLFKLCGSDPLALNAVDYAVFKKQLTVDAIKAALRKGDARMLNLPKIIAFSRAEHGRFGQYYNLPM
ncbi:MAG: hypothetical protein EBQ96_06330 [Proteobacteria bacterium]|nr:hypothetical protein [Pseudomonadota bacterium]